MTEHVQHEINYIELSVLDLNEAKRFYNEAFGWDFNDYGPDYAGIQRRGRADLESGGICRVDKVNSGGPLVILYSTDLEASLAAVTAAGGRISKEIISFPGGRRFQFLDPHGNELAVWSDGIPPEESQA